MQVIRQTIVRRVQVQYTSIDVFSFCRGEVRRLGYRGIQSYNFTLRSVVPLSAP